MEALLHRFLPAILAGDLAGALAVAGEARAKGLPFLYEQIVRSALVEVGWLWEAGQISVADEHVATAVAQSVLASFYPAFPWAPEGPKGVVACVAGERHELGARMAADLFAYDGWNVTFVGADVPQDALLALVTREAPRFVGLSFALPERLPRLRETIARLREVAPTSKLVVGGRALATVDVRGLGADAFAPSASDAVEMMRTWKS
jgi:methanogenic corrinoid protein MtbC1